jgi:4-carboxymuconolactone decarboxylase
MIDRPLPADVYPESGCRLPLPQRDELDEAGKRIYDQHTDPGGWSHAGLRGPGGIRLHSPRLSALNSAVTRYLRHDSGIPPRTREIAILVTARAFDSQFEWAAHEPVALREGVEPAIIDVIRYRRDAAGLAESDAIVIALGRELFDKRKVSSDTFARALKAFGARMLVDIVSIMGNYAGTAALLAAFDMQLPAGREPSLPVG